MLRWTLAALLATQCEAFNLVSTPQISRPLVAQPRHAAVKAEGGGLGSLLEKIKPGAKDPEPLTKEEEGMTLEKVASFGIAGVISIAIAESVFWVLSFPTSELLYFASTGISTSGLP